MRQFGRIDGVLKEQRLNTVCRSASCPNIGECFSAGHLTFMILGNVCTRSCRFCAVESGVPLPLSEAEDEAERIAAAVEELALSHIIITSVTRYDLADGGAAVFARVIQVLRARKPKLGIEILTPDFKGDERAVEIVAANPPDIWAHNLETVVRLHYRVRPQADYLRSLRLLELIKLKNGDILTKSGIMLGLGERREEVLAVLRDLRAVGVDMVTLGQYLRPRQDCLAVERYVRPEEFEEYQQDALLTGFKRVMSGPLVRSSYQGKRSKVE